MYVCKLDSTYLGSWWNDINKKIKENSDTTKVKIYIKAVSAVWCVICG